MSNEVDPNSLQHILQLHWKELTGFLLGILGVIWGMVKSIFGRIVRKADHLEERVNQLEREKVDRQELENMEERLSRQIDGVNSNLADKIELLLEVIKK